MDKSIQMSWGKKPKAITIPDGTAQIIYPNDYPKLADEREETLRALQNPVGKPSLREMARGKKSAAVIISDATRRFPRDTMLKAVVEELRAAGVKQIQPIVAAGNHPEYSFEFDDYDSDIPDILPFIRNESRKLNEYVYVGATSAKMKNFFYDYIRREVSESVRHLPLNTISSIRDLIRGRIRSAWRQVKPEIVGSIGMAWGASLKKRILIKREAMRADMRVTIGQIKPHYFTGYSGGAKSILPGVSAVTAIGPNHFMKTHPNSRLGIIRGNIVREDMEEAARLCEPLFIVNAVMDGKGGLAYVAAGDLVQAHRAGVEVSRKVSNVKVSKTDIVIISTPFPGSMNVYQTTKQVAPAAMMLKPGGVIICMGECPFGVGPLMIINQIIFNLGLKRYLPQDTDILLISDLPAKDVEETFFRPVPDIDSALAFARAKLGTQAEITIVPDGGSIVPLTGENDERYWS